LENIEENKFIKLTRELEFIVSQYSDWNSKDANERSALFKQGIELLQKVIFFRDADFEEWQSLNRTYIGLSAIDLEAVVFQVKNFKEWYLKNDSLYKEKMDGLKYYYSKNGLPEPDHWLIIFLQEVQKYGVDEVIKSDFTFNEELLIESSLKTKKRIDSLVQALDSSKKRSDEDGSTSYRYLILEKFLLESVSYKSLSPGDTYEVIGVILGLEPDTAKRYKNRNKKRGRPLISEDDILDSKEFFDDKNIGD
tara:strand:+ start:3440 stop:4192 length:753 start_codon:yes stop_codon:yes gene_type:complete